MASYSKTVSTGYRLQAEYSYTQDIPNNKTTITQKLYWMSLGSQYTVNSSASKSGWQEINGSRSGFSGAGLASLRGNQKKHLDTHIIEVTHNAAGDKTVLLEASFNPDVSLSGSNPGAINISKSVDLPKIPRASSLTSSKNWVAGGNLGITISRASSSFDHRIEVIVDGVSIVTKNDVGSSTTISFTEAQNKEIFNQLNGSASKSAQIKLTTFNGSSQIGSTATYPGTVTSPNSSTNASSMNFNIGSTVAIKLSRANSKFLHTLRFYTNNTLIKTVTGVETEYTWNPSEDEKEDMYKSMSKVNSATSKVEIDTFYSGEKVKGTTSKTGTVKVINSNPTFSNGFIYKDTNPDTVDLTGNDQYIIQNKSMVQVTLPVSARATPKNGATIVKYQATIQGVVREVPHSNSANMVFPSHGILSITDNTTLQVKAIDSRGNSTTTTKTISLLPYEIPVMTLKAERVNGFEERTKLFLNGTVSLLNIDGANKNSIQALQYRYKLQSVSNYESEYSNFSYTTNGAKYNATTVELLLDSTKAYDIEVRMQDKLGTYIANVRVGSGQPILFMDSKLKSVGIGAFPVYEYALEVGGMIHLAPNKWNSNAGGGIHAHNSDFRGLNGLYFADVVNSEGEGLMFLKSDKASDSTIYSDYDNFSILDGVGYLNNKPVFLENQTQEIWNGALTMTETHEALPNIPLNQCPNGWILLWSDYNSGNVSELFDNVYTFIPKYHGTSGSGRNGYAILCVVSSGTDNSNLTVKQVNISNTKVTGNTVNGNSITNKDIVLAKVLAW